jgi:hypothetical protein
MRKTSVGRQTLFMACVAAAALAHAGAPPPDEVLEEAELDGLGVKLRISQDGAGPAVDVLSLAHFDK